MPTVEFTDHVLICLSYFLGLPVQSCHPGCRWTEPFAGVAEVRICHHTEAVTVGLGQSLTGL